MTPGSVSVADGRTAEEVSGERDVEQLAPGTARDAVDLLGDAPGDLVAHGNPGRVRLAVALLARHAPEAELARLVKVVIELSRCCITRAITVRSLHRLGLSIRSRFFGSSRA